MGSMATRSGGSERSVEETVAIIMAGLAGVLQEGLKRVLCGLFSFLQSNLLPFYRQESRGFLLS